MKKINNIIQILQRSYEVHADEFHEYFNKEFQRSLISTNYKVDDYNVGNLNKFIDKCIFYRLGISDIQPTKKDIIYDLSGTTDPELFDESVDDIFGSIVYCAFPSKLIKKLQGQLESHKLPEDVINLIVNKLEINN